MEVSPEDTSGPTPREHPDEVIEGALQLLRGFDNAPPNEMTPLFYQHGFEELNMAMRDILSLLGHDPDA